MTERQLLLACRWLQEPSTRQCCPVRCDACSVPNDRDYCRALYPRRHVPSSHTPCCRNDDRSSIPQGWGRRRGCSSLDAQVTPTRIENDRSRERFVPSTPNNVQVQDSAMGSAHSCRLSLRSVDALASCAFSRWCERHTAANSTRVAQSEPGTRTSSAAVRAHRM